MAAESFPSSPAESSSETSSSEKKSDKDKKKEVRLPLDRVVGVEAAKDSRPAEPATKSFELPKTIDELFGRPKEAEKQVLEKPEAIEKVEPSEKDGAPVAEQAAEAATTEESAEKTIETPKADIESSAEHVEDMDNEERRDVAVRLVDARKQEIAEERSAVMPGTPAAEANAEAEAFLDNVKEQVAHGVPLEKATAVAYEQRTGEKASEVPEASEETVPIAEAAAEAASEDTPEQVVPPQDAEAAPDDDSATLASPYVAGGAGGRGYFGGAGMVGTPGWAGGPGGFNRAPGVAAAGGAARAEAVVVNGVASGLLVGGIVGYLLGRRRGRIKTERQLVPIQRKLEKQVEALHNNLAVREAQVRQFVWERAAAESREPVTAAAAEAKPASTVRIERPTPASEKKAETAKPAPKTAEKMHLDEVLKVSETIVIGSTTIRKVFETNLISERGLRRIVDEHLKGGDTRKVLTEELLIKEMSHELDPQLRDRPLEAESVARSNAQAAAMPAAALGATAAASAVTAPANATEPGRTFDTMREPSVSPMLVVANIVALAVLAGLLLILLTVWLVHR